MTGYGRGGPQEDTAAYDVNIQAACGLMEATGTQESGPIRTGAPVLDYATALAAAFAVSAALYERRHTGEGNFIDVSMLETGLSLMSSTVTDYLKTGNAPRRRGDLQQPVTRRRKLSMRGWRDVARGHEEIISETSPRLLAARTGLPISALPRAASENATPTNLPAK